MYWINRFCCQIPNGIHPHGTHIDFIQSNDNNSFQVSSGRYAEGNSEKENFSVSQTKQASQTLNLVWKMANILWMSLANRARNPKRSRRPSLSEFMEAERVIKRLLIYIKATSLLLHWIRLRR